MEWRISTGNNFQFAQYARRLPIVIRIAEEPKDWVHFNGLATSVIHRSFGVSYHPAHVSRILRDIGYSVQKPIRRATQRDEDAIARWKEDKWAEVNKTQQEDRTIVFVDESGFYLLPFVTRTYGPVGNTPIITEYLTRDHLSAISAITTNGKLSMTVQPKAFKSPDVVRQIGGKLLVIWDGSPIHRSNVIKDFLASQSAGRIHLERFPAYAPELNPDEGIWNYLKRVELKNLACQNLKELGYELRKAKERLRYKQDVTLGCIKQAGLV